MSDFKEGDLLEHRASGERCVFIRYGRGKCTNDKHPKGGFACGFYPEECIRDINKLVSVVSNGLNSEEIYSNTFELTKVKEESSE